MPLLPYTDAPDELLTLFHSEKESVLARYYEPEPGLFIAESAKVAQRAAQAGYEIRSMLIEDAQLNQEARELLSRFPDLAAYHAPSAEFRRISGYPMTRGVLALFRRKENSRPDPVRLTVQGKRIAVLVEVGNPANIGSIFRNAAALGIDQVLLSKGCCDPLSRRCLRVSMGCVFQVPWIMTGMTGAEIVIMLKQQKVLSAAMALSDDSVSITDPILPKAPRLAIFLGNEGNGLPEETIRACDYVVRIPMNKDVDSLNVAAASAVAFWQLRADS